MYVAIDFGISNTDLAISDQGKIVFHTTPSQSSVINADTLKNILKKHEIDISNVKKIGVSLVFVSYISILLWYIKH